MILAAAIQAMLPPLRSSAADVREVKMVTTIRSTTIGKRTLSPQRQRPVSQSHIIRPLPGGFAASPVHLDQTI